MSWSIRQCDSRRSRRGRFRKHRYRATGDILEARQLLSGEITLTGAVAISSFAGIGFALNPVASFIGTINGQVDNTPGDYQVQVDWGAGGGLSRRESSSSLSGIRSSSRPHTTTPR